MKKTLFIIFTILFLTNIRAQHTERFLELTKSLKAIDSSTVIRKYKNGNPKEVTNYLKYEFGDYTYEFIRGKYQLYLKDGKLFYEQEFDRFGNVLFHRQINDNGEVYKFIKTEKIDSKSKTIENFLGSDKNLIITTYEKEYTSSEKNGELSLWKEGNRINGKKVGIWKLYEFDKNCNPIVKKKNYD